MIFKTTKLLFSSLVLASSILTFNLPKVSVNAGRGNARNILYRVVTHPNGINLRNKGCEIIGKAGYGEILISSTSGGEQIATTGCNINGEKNMEMVNYGTRKDYINAFDGEVAIENIFVSTRYTRAVNSGTTGTYKNQDKVRLNNPSGGGVNLRGENCQRIMTLPNGTYSENYDQRKIDGMWGTSGNICKAGGDFYLMFPFVLKGQVYQVAEVLTRFE